MYRAAVAGVPPTFFWCSIACRKPSRARQLVYFRFYLASRTMHSSQLLALTAFAASAIAQSSSTTSSASSLPTEVTGCHEHGAGEFFCFDGDDEWEVVSSGMTAETLPSDFEDCHGHGEEL